MVQVLETRLVPVVAGPAGMEAAAEVITPIQPMLLVVAGPATCPILLGEVLNEETTPAQTIISPLGVLVVDIRQTDQTVRWSFVMGWASEIHPHHPHDHGRDGPRRLDAVRQRR